MKINEEWGEDLGIIGKVVCYGCGHIKDSTFMKSGLGPCGCGGNYREFKEDNWNEECERTAYDNPKPLPFVEALKMEANQWENFFGRVEKLSRVCPSRPIRGNNSED